MFASSALTHNLSSANSYLTKSG